MRLSDDCELNKQRLLHMEKIEFTEVVDDFVPPELEERDVVIDGLFGSGLNRPLTGGFAAIATAFVAESLQNMIPWLISHVL